MLRTVASRTRVLPLELILLSSTSSLINRFYRVSRPLASSDGTSSTSDMLTKLTATLSHPEYGRRLTDFEAESHNRILSNMRLALGNKDLSRTLEFLENPRYPLLFDALTLRDREVISKMLYKHFTGCEHIRKSIKGTPRIAVQVAAKGQTDGLKACLLLHLRHGDTSAIASLYDEYAILSHHNQTSTRLQTESNILEQPEEMEVLGYDIHFSESEEHLPIHAGATDLVLTVLASYARQDCFEDALDLVLETPMTTRLTMPKVTAFCDVHLAGDVALSSKLRMWLPELVNLRLLSRRSSLQNYVSSLANDKHIASLLKLYSTTIEECRKVNGRVTTAPNGPVNQGDGRKNSRRVVLSSDIWSIFINAFFKCSRIDLADAVWRDMSKLGITPNRYTWTTLLDGFGRLGNCEQAKSTWKRMLEAGIEPNEHSYGAMINAYFTARRPHEGFALFEQFRSRLGATNQGKRTLHDPAMLPLYNIVLHGLCTNSMDSQARDVMKNMMDHGPKPDIVSYNTFLRHYGRIGDMKNLAAVLRSLQPAGVQPDIHSFTTVLSALYKGGKRDAHTRIIQIMQTMNVQPNVAMYSAIIDFIVRQGGKENLRNADSLLRQMENNSDKGIRPNEVTYTGILAGVHRDPTIPLEEVRLYTQELFTRMHSNGTLPNRTTYHFLIKACLEHPDAQGLQMALGYYRELRKRGFALTNRTWYVILSGLLRRGDWGIAGEIVNDMFRGGHIPDGPLAVLVSKVQREISLKGVGHI